MVGIFKARIDNVGVNQGYIVGDDEAVNGNDKLVFVVRAVCVTAGRYGVFLVDGSCNGQVFTLKNAFV